MVVKIINSFLDDLGNVFDVGDTVTIQFPSGGGCGCCVITKITKSGLHYTQGNSRNKSVQFKDISEISLYSHKPMSKRKCTGKFDVAGNLLYEGDIIESLAGGQTLEIKYGRFDAYCPADNSMMDGVGFYTVAKGYPEMPIGYTEEYAKKIGDIFNHPELSVKKE